MTDYEGWVKMHRKMLNSAWFNRPFVTQIALYCILKAYWKPSKILWFGKERILNQGQFYTGLKKMCKETGLTSQNARTALKILSKNDFLTSESTNHGRIITVLNYEHYQDNEKDQQADQQAANKQPTSNQQAANTRLRIKELKNLKIKETNLVQFDEFYTLYPRHEAKAAALKAWSKLDLTNGTFESILSALRVQIPVMITKEQKFIPLPATWLNGRRWEDETKVKDDPELRPYIP